MLNVHRSEHWNMRAQHIVVQLPTSATQYAYDMLCICTDYRVACTFTLLSVAGAGVVYVNALRKCERFLYVLLNILNKCTHACYWKSLCDFIAQVPTRVVVCCIPLVTMCVFACADAKFLTVNDTWLCTYMTRNATCNKRSMKRCLLVSS